MSKPTGDYVRVCSQCSHARFVPAHIIRAAGSAPSAGAVNRANKRAYKRRRPALFGTRSSAFAATALSMSEQRAQATAAATCPRCGASTFTQFMPGWPVEMTFYRPCGCSGRRVWRPVVGWEQAAPVTECAAHAHVFSGPAVLGS